MRKFNVPYNLYYAYNVDAFALVYMSTSFIYELILIFGHTYLPKYVHTRMYVYILVNTQNSRRHILGHIAVHTHIGSVARELRLQPHNPPKYSSKQMKFGYNRNYSNPAGFQKLFKDVH